MMDRRKFIAISTVGLTAAALGGVAGEETMDRTPFMAEPPETTTRGNMPYRKLGRTGESVSLIGLGGFHIGMPEDEQASIRIIRTAVDNGLTFMDNSWDYHEGGSEIRMGKALLDGYREKVFLMSKIDGRDKKTAAQQIDESLKRLQTDRIDLMQLHEIIRLEEPDLVFSKGGAIEAVMEARKQGKIRYIGFTGHKDPVVHLRMLDMADENGFRFDAVQMPLNVMDAHFRSFQNQVLPRLIRDEIGVLGMKPMGGEVILKSNLVQPIECLHYAMSLPTSVVITGIESMPRLEQALEAARTFSPMPHERMSALLARTEPAAQKGEYELFKTTARFDATARNPHWLGDVERNSN